MTVGAVGLDKNGDLRWRFVLRSRGHLSSPSLWCEKGGQVGNAPGRGVWGQVGGREDAGGYGDDREVIGLGGGDVGGSVSDDADAGGRRAEGAGLAEGLVEDLGAGGAVVAEAAEAEVVAQAGAAELRPADGLGVAGGDAEQGAAAAEVIEDVGDAGQGVDLELLLVLLDGGAHALLHPGEARPPGGLVDAAEAERFGEDADVGVAVDGDAVEVEGAAGDPGEGVAEGEVVDGVRGS